MSRNEKLAMRYLLKLGNGYMLSSLYYSTLYFLKISLIKFKKMLLKKGPPPQRHKNSASLVIISGCGSNTPGLPK